MHLDDPEYEREWHRREREHKEREREQKDRELARQAEASRNFMLIKQVAEALDIKSHEILADPTPDPMLRIRVHQAVELEIQAIQAIQAKERAAARKSRKRKPAPSKDRAEWGRGLEVASLLLTKKDRREMFQPRFEELHEDYVLARQQFHGRWERRACWTILACRTAVLVMQCISIGILGWIVGLIPKRWRKDALALLLGAFTRDKG